MEKTTTTNADPSAVWATWADVLAWPAWTETVTSVEPLDGTTEPGVGARYALRQPRLGRATWEITEWEPGHRFTWESRGPGFRSAATHRVEPRPGGGAEASATFTWTGPLAPVVRVLFGRLAASYVETELTRLAEQVDKDER